MLRQWWWVALAIVLASVAAGLVLGVEFAAILILPNLDPVGPAPGGAPVLVVLLTLFAIPCWALGLTVFGIPLGLALKRIGRDGYVSAMLAGAIGGFLAELVVVAVFGGVSSPDILLLYPAIMIIPGAVAGLVVRKVAYA